MIAPAAGGWLIIPILIMGLPLAALALTVVVKFARSVVELLLGHDDASPKRAIVLGGIIATSILLCWTAVWFYQAPNRVTQTIWEDALVRAELGDNEPDSIWDHNRFYRGWCEREMNQTVNVYGATPDHAEVIATSYENDGWDVTRLVSVSAGTFEVFASRPDGSQRVTVDFGPTSGMSVTASHVSDHTDCPLNTIDQLNYDEERNLRVDTFPTN